MKLKVGDVVRAVKKSGYVLANKQMTVLKLLTNGLVICAWFVGARLIRAKLHLTNLVKEPEMFSFTVEVCLATRSRKRSRVCTHITTAASAHLARRKVLLMYIDEGRRVLSTQVVDRYPKGV